MAATTEYIANDVIIRLNGKDYEVGDVVTGLTTEQETMLLEKGAIDLYEGDPDPIGVYGQDIPYIKRINEQLGNIWHDIKQEFGAKGDGVTDDTEAIQTALNTLPVNSVLFFPIGTYLVTQQLTWDGTISFVGANRESTVVKANAAFSTLLYKKDEWKECGHINAMTFDGNGLVDYVLDFPQGKGVRINYNFFKNAKISVVRFGGGATWGAYEIHFFDNNIIGLQVGINTADLRPNYGLELGVNASDSEFYENIITNVKEAGILEAGGHNYVRDNHVYGYPVAYLPRFGIRITAASNHTYNNRLDTPTEAGIYVNRWGNRIENNHVFWNSQLVTNFTGITGIKIDHSVNLLTSMIVRGNFIESDKLAEDITIIGKLPPKSFIEKNITNAAFRFESIYRGRIDIPVNATSVQLTFKYEMSNWEFMVKAFTDVATAITVVYTLTGVTFNIGTPINYTGGHIFWELTPIN